MSHPRSWGSNCGEWDSLAPLRAEVKPLNGAAGLQLAVGAFAAALFPIVPRMRFGQDCLASTLYIVCSLLISQVHRGACWMTLLSILAYVSSLT